VYCTWFGLEDVLNASKRPGLCLEGVRPWPLTCCTQYIPYKSTVFEKLTHFYKNTCHFVVTTQNIACNTTLVNTTPLNKRTGSSAAFTTTHSQCKQLADQFQLPTCSCCWQAMDGNRCNIETTAPAWTINGSTAELWPSGRTEAGFWSPVAEVSPFNATQSPVNCWLSSVDRSSAKMTPSHRTSHDRGRRRCNIGESDRSTARDCGCL